MFQPLSAFIGLRYSKSKRDNNYISFISMASVFGIALGVVVLITVLSIMNGYVQGIQNRHLGMLSHITVTDSDWSLPRWEERRKQVLENPNVKSVAPFIERQVILKEANKVQPALLEAVLPELEKDVGTINRFISNGKLSADKVNDNTANSDISNTEVSSSDLTNDDKGLNLLKAGAFNIILGETLAENLGVKVGETITMLSPKQQSFIVANDDQQNPDDLIPLIKEFNVVGTFKVDLQIYDKSFAYIHLNDAATLFDMNDEVTGLRGQIQDIFKAKQVSDEIASESTEDYIITNWTTQNASFYRALQLQKTMLFLVLLLIIGVAAFNLVSTLIMVVTDKESDIAILRTLGMPPTQVMKVFIIQGALLALIGTTIGVVLGLLIATNISSIVQFFEGLFNTNLLNKEIHGLTHIDAEIQSFDVIIIAISAFVLSVVATIFPAWKASKVQPAEALRYE